MRKINRPSCPNPTALTTNYKHPENKEALINASFEKCIYCESKVTHVYFGDIEHLKPKSIYPDLEFEWDNLGFVCAVCNNAKGNKYSEDTPYINPYEENPDDFLITVGAFLKNKLGSERGELTTLDIELNRPALVEKRQIRLDAIEKAINSCMRTKNINLKNAALEAIKQESNENTEYSLFIKLLLQLHQLV